MDNQALLFIPDISGFTEFVTATEVEHSNHIIASLIETVIDANELDLVVSEIEGDAVLFYRPGLPPGRERLIAQAETMFQDFHFKLSTMENLKICSCGACTTATNLTIKFVAHYGQCREMAVHSFNKLIGSDVILAHRLLKNSVPEREYLLMSDRYLQAQGSLPEEAAVNLHSLVEEVDGFGRVGLRYLSLSHLRQG